MVLVSTLGGFYLGTQDSIGLILLFNTLLGTWFVAGGTNALNQLIERDRDAQMKRTKNRPIPAGRLTASQVAVFATFISIFGILYLCFAVNLLTGALAAVTLGSYIFIYTPLKRTTPFSTVVGAVPGALPAMGGWVAATGVVSIEAWVLFSILFFWQLPHFLAIAWIYREDYARGGFQVLSMAKQNDFHSRLYIILNCLALLHVSLLPTLIGLTGVIYFIGALILGLGFLAAGVRASLQKSNHTAKQLLHASIIYLPILMLLIFVDKI